MEIGEWEITLKKKILDTKRADNTHNGSSTTKSLHALIRAW